MKRFVLGFFIAVIAFAIAVFISMILRSGGFDKPNRVYRIGFPLVFVVPAENGGPVDYFSRAKLTADLAVGIGAGIAAGLCFAFKKRRRKPPLPSKTAGATVIDLWTKS